MTPRFVTVDELGQVYEVTTLLDRKGHRTFDPALASTCVILVNDSSVEADADVVPIYTVH